MQRFLIADDHAVTRRGIKEILQESYPFAEIVSVPDAAQLLKSVMKEEWDLIISDIAMPGTSGLEMLSELKREFPKIPVLILSMYPEEEYAVRVIKAGGAGYLCKEDAMEEELIKAVQLILQGRKYISPSVAERLALELAADESRLPHELLSDREFEVFKLLAQEVSTGKIAEQLSLSVNTIGTFRRRILEKMRMSSNAEIVTYAIRNGLVQ